MLYDLGLAQHRQVNPRNRLPIYQYDGADAHLLGAELTGQVQLGARFDASVNAGYTRGALVESDRPLPEIPLLKGTPTLAYERTPLRLDVTACGATDQERVVVFAEPILDHNGDPLLPKPPTDGYLVFDVSAQYHLVTGRLLHTFTLGVENAFDTVYRLPDTFEKGVEGRTTRRCSRRVRSASPVGQDAVGPCRTAFDSVITSNRP